MSATVPIRQIQSRHAPYWLWLGLLFCLSIGTSQAASKQPEQQASQTETKTELVKTVAQTDKPVYPETLAGAKQAFKDKKFPESLVILAKLEGNYAGQVEYDYLLGRAALETKNFDAAVAAFTRALTVDPEFAAARFELARTYYSKGVFLLARGPFEQARSEFKLVSKMNPPAELRQAINQYQAQIDTYLKVRETEFNVFVELTAGYDSNVGSFSEDGYFSYYDYSINKQVFYQLDDKDNKDRESGFTQAQAGIGIAWPLFSNDFEIFGNLQAGGRSYANNHDFDHTWNQIQLGARHYGKSDKKTIRTRFKNTDVFEEDNSKQRYHDEGELMLEWAIKLNDRNAITLWGLGGDSSYHVHDTHVFSVNYNRQGAEWTHLSNSTRKSSYQLLLVTGRDNPKECKDFVMYCPSAYARDVNGLRLGWSTNIFDATRFYSSFYMQYSEYDQNFFYQRRIDRRAELVFATNTSLAETWSVRSEIHLIDNNSSVDLYDHERWLASATLGWGF